MTRSKRLLLGVLALVFLGAGIQVSWGHAFMKGWKKWLAEQAARDRLPKPPPPPDHAERVRSAVATLKEMCSYMAREHVDALEFARRFGTVTDDLGEAVYFQPHEPLLRDHRAKPLKARIATAPEFYGVDLYPDGDHLLTIADLEPHFGTPYADDPAAFFVELWFPWEPQGEGKMRCRLRARVKYGEEGGYDDKTLQLEPDVDRTLVHLDAFYLDRGVIEGAGGVLSAEPILHPAVPSSGNQARR